MTRLCIQTNSSNRALLLLVPIAILQYNRQIVAMFRYICAFLDARQCFSLKIYFEIT